MARRRYRRVERNADNQHRVNHRIRISPIRVVGPDGEQIGVMSADEGRAEAKRHGLDLVEVAPKARPPVCRIMDYGKFRYQQSKRSKGNTSRPQLKTLRLRPKIDDHDLDTKVRKAEKFLDKGNPVRFVMRMRGRERSYALEPRWIEKMNEVIEAFGDDAEVAVAPQREGRTITATIEPAST